MNGFFKLLDFEIRRFRWVLVALMAQTAVFQIGTEVAALAYAVADRKKDRMELGGSGPYYDQFSLADAVWELQLWFALPVLVCVAVIGLYIFFIWYREWFGKDTFIYRLLMLPIPRTSIYWAKLSAILVFIFSLLAFQLVLIMVEQALYVIMVPEDMREPCYLSDVIAANAAWSIVLPARLDEFAVSYGLGIIGVMVVFTAILLERSFRGTGIVYGILYAAACTAAVVLPMPLLGLWSQGAILYPEEILAVNLILCLAVAILSLGLSFRLLNRKLTV